MPFKHNAARRHRIPMVRYRVRNWREYEAGLRRRGDLTLWLDQAAMAGWHAPRRTTPGGQAWYSDVAIELVLMLRLVFHLGLRQAEGFATSVLRLLGQELRVPDHYRLGAWSGRVVATWFTGGERGRAAAPARAIQPMTSFFAAVMGFSAACPVTDALSWRRRAPVVKVHVGKLPVIRNGFLKT